MTREYVHQVLGEEIRSVSGQYTVVKENRVSLGGGEVFYLVAHAMADTSCCGMGGMAYAIVPGRLVRWHFRETLDGEPVSQVEPVSDAEEQRRIESWIIREESVSQVRFLG
ncbi:MAG: hypothetical protein ACLFOY_11785 [Desulfatibacillaceae bacterium]